MYSWVSAQLSKTHGVPQAEKPVGQKDSVAAQLLGSLIFHGFVHPFGGQPQPLPHTSAADVTWVAVVTNAIPEVQQGQCSE